MAATGSSRPAPDCLAAARHLVVREPDATLAVESRASVTSPLQMFSTGACGWAGASLRAQTRKRRPAGPGTTAISRRHRFENLRRPRARNDAPVAVASVRFQSASAGRRRFFHAPRHPGCGHAPTSPRPPPRRRRALAPFDRAFAKAPSQFGFCHHIHHRLRWPDARADPPR
jgi:hypothetical protein